MRMLIIDGSQGEGGGQIVRASLSLSALTGRPFQIVNIRASRSKPGLRPQHLTAVQAVAAICGAELSGAELNSETLTFRPTHPPVGGDYYFDVNAASQAGNSSGAATLIMQAVLWPLLFADRPSTVTLRGGTHVSFSPSYHYFAEVARPAFARLGADFNCDLQSWGWQTAGNGVVTVKIKPVSHLTAATFEPVASREVYGVAAVSNLPAHIPQRMSQRAVNLLAAMGFKPHIQPTRTTGAGPGAGIFLWLEQAGFACLGRPGLPAEKVAETAVKELNQFVDNPLAAVDRYLADQLLLPMALADGRSQFTANEISQHTRTNANLLRQWLDVPIEIDDLTVAITGLAHKRS
jgi:RNA 3'-terminal phosphate cyclase (ATP)